MDQVEQYQSALKQLEDIKKDVEILVKKVADMNRKVQCWTRLVFPNTDFRIPQELMNNPNSQSLLFNEWPTFSGFSEKVNEYRKACGELCTAWDAIPESRRYGLASPQDDQRKSQY